MKRSSARSRRSTGQSVVEFALVLPILVVLLVAIVDLGRIYTSMLTIESAAREAADYATFGAQRWDGEAAVANTHANLYRRACVASKNLPGFAGNDDACSNPEVSYCLSPDEGVTCVDYDPSLACGDPEREPPCRVTVTLRYRFDLLVPLSIEALGTRIGFPSSITFERSSTFPMTDLEIPTATPAPVPAPEAVP